MEMEKVDEIRSDKTLPEELIFIIFTKLPAKSICRLRCISDQWNSTFSDNYFIKSHHQNSLSRSSNPNPILITFPNETNKAKLIYTSAAKSSDDETLIAVADLQVSVLGWTQPQVTESVNGLICFVVEKQYRVCNPTTRDFISLPLAPPLLIPNVPKAHYFYNIIALGYDSVQDRYKVLNSWVVSSGGVTTMEHHVFVLDGADSWRRIDGCLLHISRKEGVCLNSSVYYRAGSGIKHPRDGSAELLVEFDVRLETFRYHKLSNTSSYLDEGYTILIPLDGKLTIVYYKHLLSRSKVNFWVCEDLVKRRWVHKRIRFSCAWKGDALNHDDVFHFAGSTRAGEIIMAPCKLSESFYLIYFGLKNGKARRVQIHGLPDKGCQFGAISQRFTATDHVENLVSLKCNLNM